MCANGAQLTNFLNKRMPLVSKTYIPFKTINILLKLERNCSPFRDFFHEQVIVYHWFGTQNVNPVLEITFVYTNIRPLN